MVLDAAALSRSLYLLAQVARAGRPVAVAVTMLDVAREHGSTLDVDLLADELGVPVVGVDPRSGAGLDGVAVGARRRGACAWRSSRPRRDPTAWTPRPGSTCRRGSPRPRTLFAWVEDITARLAPPLEPHLTRTDRVDRFLLNPWIGLPVFGLVLCRAVPAHDDVSPGR